MAEVNEDLLAAVERELSELAAVQPSPEFAAKVRSRIQREPPGGFGWRWFALASSIAVAILLVFVSARHREDVIPSTTNVHADVALPRPVVTSQPAVTSSPPVRGPSARVARQARRPEPEVLIDPSVAAAVRRLATELPRLPEVPAEPSLDPVVLEPLTVPDVSEFGGVRPLADPGRR